MQLFIDFLISRIGSLFIWLDGHFIVTGVSLLGFFAAIFVITLVIHNLVHKAG